MNFAEELRGSLQEFLVGASIEIRENGSRITAISRFPGKFAGSDRAGVRTGACADRSTGILDLLGITRAGLLAILELKTTEDSDLEFLRPEMRRSHPHRPGRELASRPPRDDAPVMPSAPHKYSPCSEATLRYDSAFSHLTD